MRIPIVKTSYNKYNLEEIRIYSGTFINFQFNSLGDAERFFANIPKGLKETANQFSEQPHGLANKVIVFCSDSNQGEIIKELAQTIFPNT